jgi:hypothetical protein
MWELWPVIVAGAIVAYCMLRYRETFIMKYGNPFDDEDLVSFDKDAKGTRVFSTIFDNTCPTWFGDRSKTELDAGLCYQPCDSGYNGVGPVCWAETVNIGVGRPVGLEPCNPGWVNEGLICREPITCTPIKCATGLDFFRKGCTGGGCSGGRLQGRLNGDPGGICDHEDKGNLPNWLVDSPGNKNAKATHPVNVASLCYRKCPKDKPDRVPGMPYLCFKNTRGLSYGRGVGDVPPMIQVGP